MENSKELFVQAVSALLFCMAVTVLFYQSSSYMKLVQQIKSTYEYSAALYTQEHRVTDDTITYGELIATLFDTLEYDVEINDLLISKYEHTEDSIEAYHIVKTKYSRHYDYDSRGNITRIIYKSV